MSDDSDLLGESLSEEDLTFLKSADGFRGAFDKIKQAKKLIAEARAEIRAIVATEVGAQAVPEAAPTKKGKRAAASGLTDAQQKVLAAVKAGKDTRPTIDEATGLKAHVTKHALQTLREQGLVRMKGKGRGGRWVEGLGKA